MLCVILFFSNSYFFWMFKTENSQSCCCSQMKIVNFARFCIISMSLALFYSYNGFLHLLVVSTFCNFFIRHFTNCQIQKVTAKPTTRFCASLLAWICLSCPAAAETLKALPWPLSCSLGRSSRATTAILVVSLEANLRP